jgi:hypothetical protein
MAGTTNVKYLKVRPEEERKKDHKPVADTIVWRVGEN